MNITGRIKVYVDGVLMRDTHNKVVETGYDSCALILGRAACGLKSVSGFQVRLYSRGSNDFSDDMVTVDGDMQGVTGAYEYSVDTDAHSVSLDFDFSPYSFNGTVELTTAALYFGGEIFSVADITDEDEGVFCEQGKGCSATWTLTFTN